MKKDVLFLIAGLLVNVELTTGFETVWVRDVTAQFQADKRGIDNLDLPDQLTFDLRRGFDNVTLNLEKNYEIDPNADIYLVQKLKNGRSFLAKANELEKEAVGYYQDKDNGAYMTVRCVKRSNYKCDRVIYGNIRIGDYNYDVRPVETDVTDQRYEVPSVFGKRYFLMEEANIEQENIVERFDMENVSETNFKEELNARLQRFTGEEKQNRFHPLDVSLPRYVTDLQDKRTHDKTRQLRHDYYVKVAALIDFGLYSLYASRVHPADSLLKNDEVRRKIREAFSHIMNGVNFRYKTIDDPSISVNIILQQFVFFEKEFIFPHNRSSVIIENGTKYINAHLYLGDIVQWVKNIGNKMVPPFDHAMLFTTYDLYHGSIKKNNIDGISLVGAVCSPTYRISLIQTDHYSRTVKTATHELGHNLGAYHDGELDAIDCKAEDSFIMSPITRKFNRTTPYSRNPWIFSNCSVESFKKTLISLPCVHYNSSVYDTDEWTQFMRKDPGDVFTPDEQCWILYGPNYIHYQDVNEDSCRMLKCLNVETKLWYNRFMYAARGTKCGNNMWCIEGKCVSKCSK